MCIGWPVRDSCSNDAPARAVIGHPEPCPEVSAIAIEISGIAAGRFGYIEVGLTTEYKPNITTIVEEDAG